ncbi:PTS sugar transporter subunit IIB, partial [Lactiplantibacillus plantarum]|uniref:PTS sugar transporter subunit IIB n=1 Tax=Lactiplantibacillus plantarum TaxID=1590 RepID=UPI00093258A5
SSFMVQMNIQSILKDENVKEDIQVDHSDVGSVGADSADYFFVESTLQSALGSIPENKVVLLKSLIDKQEVRDHVNTILDQENIEHD